MVVVLSAVVEELGGVYIVSVEQTASDNGSLSQTEGSRLQMLDGQKQDERRWQNDWWDWLWYPRMSAANLMRYARIHSIRTLPVGNLSPYWPIVYISRELNISPRVTNFLCYGFILGLVICYFSAEGGPVVISFFFNDYSSTVGEHFGERYT